MRVFNRVPRFSNSGTAKAIYVDGPGLPCHRPNISYALGQKAIAMGNLRDPLKFLGNS